MPINRQEYPSSANISPFSGISCRTIEMQRSAPRVVLDLSPPNETHPGRRVGTSRRLMKSPLLPVLSLALASPALAQLTTSHRLVFADEFTGTAVDTTKWAVPGPSWTMPNSASTASANQVSVGDGVLTLNATRSATSGTTQFSSGSISSYGVYNFDGGYVEASIDLPGTPGSWPAFWGLYTGWPPEADIMEYPLTTDGGTNGYVNDTYHTAYHYTNASGAAAAGAGPVDTNQNLATSGYHIFAMDWVSDTSMKFFMDGAQKSSFTNGADVAEMVNMYMILDYAVGGWPGTPSTTQWPLGASDQTKVDWVRIWQINPNGDTTSNWNLNGGGAFATTGNWANGISPAFGNQTAVFGRVGTAATATITFPSWRVFGNVIFNGGGDGTTAYTLGSSTNLIQLAGQPLGASPVGASVQASASSTVNQNLNAKVQLWSPTTARNDMTGGQTLNFNSQLSGNGALNVTGAGPTVLNATNIHTGGTNIGTAQEAAVLRASADNALGVGSVVIGASGNATTARLELSNGCTQTSAIDFRGRTNNSVGIQSLSGTNTLIGGITATAGGNLYQIQSDTGTLTLAGSLQAGTGSRTFTLQGSGSGTASGPIQNGGGTVALAKDGSGTWSLTGPNTYTGATNVTSGTLRLTSVGAVASYSFDNVSGSTIVNGGSGGTAMNGTLTSGATVVSGGRTGNAVSLSGGAYVNINSPIMDLGNNGSWTITAWVKTSTAGSTILSKATGNSWATGNSVFYLGDGSGAGSGGIPSAVRFAGGFYQGAASATSVTDNTWHLVTYVNSGGVCAIYVDGIAQSLSTSNSGFGNADVGTTVRLGFTTNTVAADGTVHFNGLLDEVQFFNQALSPAQIAMVYQGLSPGGSLPATASVTIASGATFDVNGVSQTIGTVAGAGSLTKSGAGTLTFGGANAHTGATSLNGGTLVVNGSMASGGTLITSLGTILKGTGTVNATTTINGTHQPGSSAGTQTFGALTYGSTARLSWELTANSDTSGFDKVVSTSAATLTSGAAIDMVSNSAGSTVNFSNGFWTQPHSWPVLTAASFTGGGFVIGTVSADPSGRLLSNYGTLSLSQSATAASLVYTPYTPQQLWQRQWFGVDWNNPLVSGNSADPDRDGTPNLTEWALGMNPNAADAVPWKAGTPGLPVQAITTTGGHDYLSLRVRRPIGIAGITYRGKVSDDLVSWSDAVQGTITPNGDGSETVIFLDPDPTSQHGHRFIRLVITP